MDIKQVIFCGRSHADLCDFPADARHELGFQLGLIQQGKEPDDWKPMGTVGAGVNEIRVKEESGAFRVFYVAKFADNLYVLHCFQKKTQQTSQPDIELGRKRYRDLMKELKNA